MHIGFVRFVRYPAEKVKEPCGSALSIGALHFVAHEVERHNCAGKTDSQRSGPSVPISSPQKRTCGAPSPTTLRGLRVRGAKSSIS